MKEKKGAIVLGIGAVTGLLFLLFRKKKPAIPVPPDGVASLFGRVVDGSTGSLLSDVTVTLAGGIAQTSTGTDGRFWFDGLSLGLTIVWFQKDDYETDSRRPTLVSGDNDLGDIFIYPSTTTLGYTGPTYG